MNQFIVQVVPVLQTALVAILIALIGYIGQAIVKVVPKLVDLTVAKIGLTKYTKTKAIATDIFNKVNEDGRLGTLVNSKSDTFVALIKTKIPSITDEDIDLLKQSLSGEYNKDKAAVIKELDPVIEAKVPIIKYYAADGTTELQPVTPIVTPTV